MYTSIWKHLALIFGAMTLVLAFQNCSEAEFSQVEPASSNKGMDVGDGQEVPVDPDVPTAPTDPGDDSDGVDDDNDGENVAAFGCTPNTISDIRLNIESFHIGRTEVTGAIGIQSLVSMAEGFSVLLDNKASSGQIRLVLSDINNQVVDTSGQAYALKTPSAQQSGLKIVARGKLDLKGNTAYTIRFHLDPETQIVRTGSGKCILKPTLQMEAIEEFEF